MLIIPLHKFIIYDLRIILLHIILITNLTIFTISDKMNQWAILGGLFIGTVLAIITVLQTHRQSENNRSQNYQNSVQYQQRRNSDERRRRELEERKKHELEEKRKRELSKVDDDVDNFFGWNSESEAGPSNLNDCKIYYYPDSEADSE